MLQSRQLAAIMFTDIVGYTALMGEDEQKAFDFLQKNRELQRPLIEQYGGRWIKELGDGVMASFNTVSDAVNAAVAIQKECKKANNFQLRIGIHQGEVVAEADDVFGDAVNITSRIQACAKPGSIFISEAVYNNVFNKKDIHTKFIKEETLKNVKDPVRMYEVMIPENVESVAPTNHEPSNTVTGKSIAVLPFVNMSNDAGQEYFCDGISEEIINALAQLNNLRVIARTSAFTFKNKNIDVREIGKLLDVQTLLEGSVRKSNNRLRIVTQLVRVSDGAHLWSNRYDRELGDIFTIQEDIAENVATALQGVLTPKEKEAIRRPETNIEAYEYYLKGRQLFHQLGLNASKIMFEKAISLDAGYALAYSGLADAYAWNYEWEGGGNKDLVAAERYSWTALSLAPDLSESHSSRGYVLSLGKNYVEAEKEFKEAIRLNPNSFITYYLYGRTCFAWGQIEKSAEMFQKASEVNREDFQSVLLLAQSLRVLGKEEAKEITLEGINRARKQLELNPSDRRVLSLAPGSLFEVGEREEAFQWMLKGLELYPEDAGVLINGVCLYAKDNNREKALDLLEKAVGKGFGKKDWIEHDPDYDNLREEPRFKALMSKLP
jgi:adenylate cyclase